MGEGRSSLGMGLMLRPEFDTLLLARSNLQGGVKLRAGRFELDVELPLPLTYEVSCNNMGKGGGSGEAEDDLGNGRLWRCGY